MQMEEEQDPAPSFERTKPRQAFAYVEYPGYVSPRPASTRKALNQMGGLALLERVLTGKPAEGDHIELQLRPANALGHPVLATTLEQNQIVLKVVTRRLKVVEGIVPDDTGVFTVEFAGAVANSTYFRAMADFEVVTNPDDPIVVVANAVRDKDVDAIQAFKMAEEETGEHPDVSKYAEINVMPAPAFSRSTISHIYDFKPSTTTVRDLVAGPDGVEYERLKTTNEWKASAPITITFEHEGPVPEGPSATMIKESEKDPDSKPVQERLLKLLKSRPVWTRPALTNHLTVDELRTVTNKKRAIPMVSYTFSNGAFRDMVIRFGYDPRTEYDARLYQHIALRNADNKYDHVKQGQVHVKKNEAEVAAARKLATKYHIFDGKTMPSPSGNYQLADITWPLARKIIMDERMYETEPTLEDGYWKGELFDIVRRLIKRKQAGLLKQEPVTDEMCQDLILALEEKLEDITANGRDSISKRKKQKRIARDEDGDEEDAEESEEEEEAVETDEGSESAGSSAKGSRAASKGKSPAKKIAVKKVANTLKPHWEVHTKKKNAPKPSTMSATVRAQKLRDAIGLHGEAAVEQSVVQARSKGNRSRSRDEDEEEEAQETDESD